MVLLGMLFAVLVLGPLVILAVMAVASNERAVAWLGSRMPFGRPHGGRPAADGAAPQDSAPAGTAPAEQDSGFISPGV
jgi:hypothetical protein